MAIDDDMDDMNDDMKERLAEPAIAKRAKQDSIQRTINAHMGPAASTVDRNFVNRLVLHRRQKKQSNPIVLMDTSNDNPPPPPPGAGAISAKTIPVRKPMYEKKPVPIKSKKKDDLMDVEVSNDTNSKPPPPPPAAGAVVVKIHKKHLKGATTTRGRKKVNKDTQPEQVQPPAVKIKPTAKPSKRSGDDIPKPTKKQNIEIVSNNIYLKPNKPSAKPSKAPPKVVQGTVVKTNPIVQGKIVKVKAPTPSRVAIARAATLITAYLQNHDKATKENKDDAKLVTELLREHHNGKMSKARKKEVNDQIRQIYRKYYPKIRT